MLSRSLKSCDSSNGQILIFVPDNPLQSMTLICGRGGGFRARIPLLPRARTRHDFSKTAPGITAAVRITNRLLDFPDDSKTFSHGNYFIY